MNDPGQPEPWRPKLYPAQSCTQHAPCEDSTLSLQPEECPGQLPATVQAIQDSRFSYSTTRTIVICLDGTGDKFDNDNSNVVNFVACLKKDDPSQVTYYQSGIGTYDGHGLKNGFSAIVDMAVGSGLGIHIKDAYHFLMQNYREGDKICLLGFSRGSYTVRCLAGMLHKVGLLPAHNSAQIPFAYRFYKNDTLEGRKLSAEFKKTFCTSVQVYFVGVWDCVASVGFVPRKLPFSKSPTKTIHYFRHAMALDEHRAKFKVCQWQHQHAAAESRNTVNRNQNTLTNSEKDNKIGRICRMFSDLFDSESSTGGSGTSNKQSSNSCVSQPVKIAERKEQNKLESQRHNGDRSMYGRIVTDVLEVWFIGAHADVGGGAVRNDERHMLSRIPLRWMIRQCFECNTGILFGTAALAEVGIDVLTVWPIYKTPKKPVVGPSPNAVEQYETGALPPLGRRSTVLVVDNKRRKSEGGREDALFHSDNFDEDEKRLSAADLVPEQVEDHFDAMAPINDQLEQAKWWWVLELWPVKIRVSKNKSTECEKVVRMNMGRFRAITEKDPAMHWTVQMRMSEKSYKIRNNVDRNTIWKIIA